MARKKTKTTIALEKISQQSGLGIKHLRELSRQGLPLGSPQAALNWLADRPDQSPVASSVEALRLARLRLVNSQTGRANLDLAIRRGIYISREENELSDARIAHATAAMVRKLEEGLPPLVFGQHEFGKIKRAVKDFTRDIQKARLSLENDPAVAKLRKDAEATRPAHIEPPFRGKVTLATV